MPGNIQPLDQKFAIVDSRGNPTDYFIRWAQQKQIDISGSITLSDLQTYLTAHKLQAGTGIGLTPDGNINNSPTISAKVQEILDQITSTRGAVVYRGSLGWAALLPGTSGYVLSTNGAGADPSWIAAGGGGGGSTPTVRASNIQSSSNSSYTVTWPTGTIAGDVVFIFGGHGFGFNNPANWLVLDNQTGGNFNGVTLAKVMTAADITAGSVTITTAGAFNGVLAAVTVSGTTMAGLRLPGVFVRSSSGPAAATANPMQNFAAFTADLVLAFASSRVAGNFTFSAGITSLQAINAANASGAVGRFSGTLTALGVNETWQSSVAGSGYYSAAIALRGP